MNSQDAARTILAHGWTPVPVRPREKAPCEPGWQEMRVAESDIPRRFSTDANLGVVTGKLSQGLTDIDLDCDQAVMLAEHFLPVTRMRSGHGARRLSHWFYRVIEQLPTSAVYKDVDTDRTTLVELRTDGHQTLVPPSVHPNGDVYEWEGGLEPAECDGDELSRRVGRLAAAALLVRHWPREKGSRHDIANALAGMLVRGGWSDGDVSAFVSAVATGAGDEEARSRAKSAATTARKHGMGGRTTGTPTLAALIGDQAVEKVREWLRLNPLTAFTASTAYADTTEISWPAAVRGEALYGLAGDFVRLIEPHTEADPVAILMQFLVAFGNCVGRHAYYTVEADSHYPNLFVGIVGATSKGRKGTSWGQVKRLYYPVVKPWVEGCIASGLSTGEGLISAVHDEITKHEPIKKRGGLVVGYQDVVIEPAITDKRLLAYQSELALVLRLLGRDGNTLSATIRDAWDTGNLRTLTKHSPTRATGAHISIIGHITRDELLRYLDTTEVGNGFANRFLWVCVRRSKLLPDGGDLQDVPLDEIRRRLERCLRMAQAPIQITRNAEAAELWRSSYAALSDGKPGLLGAVVSRGEAQVTRLSVIFALLDGSTVITRSHLEAALAVWEYAEASARYIFGDSLGDPVADTILKGLRGCPEGLTRDDIRNLFGRNLAANKIARALRSLTDQGLAHSEIEKTDGRPAERWYAGSGYAVNAINAVSPPPAPPYRVYRVPASPAKAAATPNTTEWLGDDVVDL